ncbi:hypothetical protein CEUSTIGMA_g3170.t1 [Chlamydomonas eustigma]|uniref:Calcium-dependent protein kinase n=1 Tax=Chlamydomonas eustigma TaxID=1157962 RepID=A0A250WY17_9CHLO|nr:hypothetical protein CEUSTIGMA_g3170.t1 [Chlamydomonas eustigma]|eukprot:GAX75727.1 hypothetical protein CEUSTIGMA_g3170.t1 [Chlamydomonas eustigma]
MGACQSSNAAEWQQSSSKSLKSTMSVMGPTPSILPGREKFDDVDEKFLFEKELRRGTIAIAHRVRDKETKQVYVSKTTAKAKLESKEDLKEIQRELKIFKHVSGHENICKFVQNYEDQHSLHIIVEECSGGDLFERLQKEKMFDEQLAARAIHAVASMILHCHSMNVVHRDIRPEVFMFSSTVPEAPLKAVDFRYAKFWKKGLNLDEVVGCPHYVAPDMLCGSYGPEVDIWGCGVLLYVLLAGYTPFDGKTDNEIFEQILSCPLDLKSAPWPKISKSAKDLIRKMLTRDPKRRIHVDQVLHHPWLKEQIDVVSSEPQVLVRMREFTNYNKLKKEAAMILAKATPEDHLEGLRHLFASIDTDSSGHISVEEMRRSLKHKGALMGQTEVSKIMNKLDLDGDQRVDYSEFTAATLRLTEIGLSDLESQGLMLKAFNHFDQHEQGYLTKEDVKNQLQLAGMEVTAKDLDQIMAEVDLNEDGKIDFNEFCQMITPQNSQRFKISATLGKSRAKRTEVKQLQSIRVREVPAEDVVLETENDSVIKDEEQGIKPTGRNVKHQDSGASAASIALSGLLSGSASVDGRSSAMSDHANGMPFMTSDSLMTNF